MCKTVTFCGHRDLPDRAAVEAWLRRTLPCLYAQGARRFYVGGYGAFDAAAAAAALSLRAAHPEVEVVLVRPYLDAGPAPQPGMADQADVVVACVQRSWGGAAEMLRYAQRRGKAVLSFPPPRCRL